MYIARIHILNYRCFKDTSVEFQPGLNVIIGENNTGKTTLLRALSLIFDRRGRSRPTVYDFHRLLDPMDAPPNITVELTLRSSKSDTEADRALVASWLTSLAAQWEAQLTYVFFLPDQHHKEFTEAVRGLDRDGYFEIVEEFVRKYVSRVFAGNPDTMVSADGESLSKFDCQFIDAMRDVENELFAGSNPLLRSMLQEVLDFDKKPEESRTIRRTFREKSNTLRDELVSRLDTKRLFELATATGAADGGTPEFRGAAEEAEFIAALRLFITRQEFSFPATHQGLGYNNLLYISLLLASLSLRVSREKRGQNAAIFPMLLIEEPEAHLHPALQYKLLTHIVSRVEPKPNQNRQVFVTTHSTHITAAAGLKPIIALYSRDDGSIGVSYPARLFSDSDAGRESKGYVERFLDATKSTMLFAKSTLFVEGIAEQLIVPALARMMNRSFEEHHVAVVRVDGVTFKHFLPLFGAGVGTEQVPFVLDRRVACLIDADPSRRARAEKGGRRKSCYPFQLNRDLDCYEYFAQSGAVTNLQALVIGRANIGIFFGAKTFEYDLALDNSRSRILITKAMENAEALESVVSAPNSTPDELQDILADDVTIDLAAISDAQERYRQRYAAMYLTCCDKCKGEHAFALEETLRRIGTADDEEHGPIECPDHVRRAIIWVTSRTKTVKPS